MPLLCFSKNKRKRKRKKKRKGKKKNKGVAIATTKWPMEVAKATQLIYFLFFFFFFLKKNEVILEINTCIWGNFEILYQKFTCGARAIFCQRIRK
jgi:hypothetical protein